PAARTPGIRVRLDRRADALARRRRAHRRRRHHSRPGQLHARDGNPARPGAECVRDERLQRPDHMAPHRAQQVARQLSRARRSYADMAARSRLRRCAGDDRGSAMLARSPVPRAQSADGEVARYARHHLSPGPEVKMMSWSGSVRMVAGMVALHAVAVLLCLVLFLVVSAAGLFGGVSILFYRGISVLVALAPVMFVMLLLLLRLPWAAR